MALRNHAQEVFRSDTGSFQDLVPRQKFNFRLLLETPTTQTEVLRVTTVSMPSWSFDTQILNQYNKKRVVQGKLNYDPMTVSFYDTFDNEFVKLLKDYTRHYYNNGRGLDYFNETSREVIDPIYSTSMGYTLTTAENRYYFDRIIIEQSGNANVSPRQIILKHPMITNVQSDTLSYADSQGVTFTVTFQPESIHIKEDDSNRLDHGYDENPLSVLRPTRPQ